MKKSFLIQLLLSLFCLYWQSRCWPVNLPFLLVYRDSTARSFPVMPATVMMLRSILMPLTTESVLLSRPLTVSTPIYLFSAGFPLNQLQATTIKISRLMILTFSQCMSAASTFSGPSNKDGGPISGPISGRLDSATYKFHT